MRKDEQRVIALILTGKSLRRNFGYFSNDILITKEILSKIPRHKLETEYRVAMKMAKERAKVKKLDGKILDESAYILN